MEVWEALKNRKSMRVFEDRAIDEEIKEQLYAAAMEAPSAGNQLLYSIIEVREEEKRKLLAETCDQQYWILKAPLIVVFVADHRRWCDLYRAAGCTPRKPGLGDAWLAMSDANIAAQNMVIAAESFGLGSCYIGDIIEQHEQVKEALCLPDEVFPACMLVIGHPSEQQKQRKKPARFHRDYIVHTDVYHTMEPQVHQHFFEERALRNETPVVDFPAQVEAFWKRKYESVFSREMNRSARAYLAAFAEETEEEKR